MAVHEGTRRIVGGVDTHSKDLHVSRRSWMSRIGLSETRSFATTRQTVVGPSLLDARLR